MALGIFKKAWNTTQLTNLTDYLTSRVMAILTDYVTISYFNQALGNATALLIPKLSTNNTASGTFSATLNATSGIVQYSGTVSGNDYAAFTLTNSFVSSSSVIMFSIKSPSAGTGAQGLPYIQSYSISGSTVTIIVANSDSNATNSSFYLNFLIVS